MVTRKEVLYDIKTNSVEVAWIEVITPAIDVPESRDPNTLAENGESIPGAVIPAYTIPAVELRIKCHTYSDRQMDDLRTDIGDDAANYESLLAQVESSQIPYPPPTVAEIVADITSAAQHRLDAFAQTRGYDDLLSACTYANSSVEKFAAEGRYCNNIRDLTWSILYTVMSEVQSGARPMPTGFTDVEAYLPVLVWPK